MYKTFLLSAVLFSISTYTAVINSQEGVRLGIPVSEEDLSQFDLIAGPDGSGFPPGSGTARQGKEVFDVNCAVCHGANGEGNQALNAPRIAGQFDWYTHRQLMNWKNGVRGTHPKDMYGMQMIGMAATLVDETAVKNISAYIANLGK